MKPILTTEEKTYLKRINRYLLSLGAKDGVIQFPIEYGEDFSPDHIDWDYVTEFEVPMGRTIPSGLIPILQKIMKSIGEEGNYADDDGSFNYQVIECYIDTSSKDIGVIQRISSIVAGDSTTIEYDEDEEMDLITRWGEELFSKEDLPADGILSVSYNGSGDSGYLESSFDENGEQVPTEIENWCYDKISENFSGWENNEGADGRFIFDFNQKLITLVHTDNVEVDEGNTLYEEHFGE